MDKIEIKGYKTFKNLSLTLNKLNILIGANGAGKSNFLSFFEFLNALYDQRLSEYVGLRGGTEKFLYEGSKITSEITAKLSFGGDSYAFTLKEGDGRFVFTNERLAYVSTNYDVDYDNDITHYGNESFIKNYKGFDRSGYIKKYLSEIRKYHFHDTGQYSPFTRTSNIYNDKYYLYSKGENLAAFLYNIKKDFPYTYRRMLMVIRSVAPYFNDFYFNIDNNGNVRLQWKDKYSEMIYGPTDLSDGTIRFIALTVLFLQPKPSSVIIIIDEPELGLHPYAIAKLAGLIRSVVRKDVQVIAATQSAELISNFEPEDVITVNQVNGESVLKRLNSNELSSWLNDYSLGDLWMQNIITGEQP